MVQFCCEGGARVRRGERQAGKEKKRKKREGRLKKRGGEEVLKEGRVCRRREEREKLSDTPAGADKLKNCMVWVLWLGFRAH
jgi:hypothetical protein